MYFGNEFVFLFYLFSVLNLPRELFRANWTSKNMVNVFYQITHQLLSTYVNTTLFHDTVQKNYNLNKI